MRASIEATIATTIPNSPTIHLKPHTPSQSQDPEPLPVSPSGTETQESDAQGFTTSFLSEPVAETQEPTTQSAVATQEPAADLQNADAQEIAQSVVATQEPVVDLQNLDAQEIEQHVAVTQEPAANSQNLDAQDIVQ